MKICTECGVEKDEFEFSIIKKRGKDYRIAKCKECKSEIRKRQYIQNKEHESVLNKKWREANKEHCKEWRKKWRKAHPEKMKEKRERYKKAHPEKVKEREARYFKAYYKAHPEKMKERRVRYKEKNPLVGIWGGMKKRCYNEKDKCWDRYGGRGIKIYQEWLDDWKKFQEFALQNGYIVGYSIHRINNDGDYTPANVRFLSKSDHSILHEEIKKKKR